MLLKHVLLLLILSILSSMTLTVAGLLYVEHVNMVDSVYTKYGFPYWWLMHVGVTIAGVTDVWRFEASNLVKDAALFFLLSLGSWFLVLVSKERMTLATKTKSKLKITILALFALTSASFVLCTLFYHIAIDRTPSFHLTLKGDLLGEISLMLIPVTLVFFFSTAALSTFALIRFLTKKLKRQ